MGMDAYIFRARSKKVFKSDDWYNSKDVTEVWYARKFWDLVNHMSCLKDEDDNGCSQFIKLKKSDIEEMIEIATHNKDYWGGFDSVPQLCQILYDFDTDEENGWHYYFEYDY